MIQLAVLCISISANRSISHYNSFSIVHSYQTFIKVVGTIYPFCPVVVVLVLDRVYHR